MIDKYLQKKKKIKFRGLVIDLFTMLYTEIKYKVLHQRMMRSKLKYVSCDSVKSQ